MRDTIPQRFLEIVQAQPEVVAQYAKDASGEFRPKSYAALAEDVAILAAGLKEIGLARGERIGLICDNRPEWLVADLAILGLGAADVPRGCDATEEEIRYILGFSECRIAFLENEKQLLKVLRSRKELGCLEEIVLFDEPGSGARSDAADAGFKLRTYAELRGLGITKGGKDGNGAATAQLTADYAAEAARGGRDELATLIYTSGTTGEPKGVMLSHGNFLYQTEMIIKIIHIRSGHTFLSVLPIWHVFERIAQYMIIVTGASLAYSKPIGSVMLADLRAVRPQWMASVPRIWEAVQEGVYRTIRQQGGAKRFLFSFFVGVGETWCWFKNHLLGRVPDFDHRLRALEIAAVIIPFLLLAPLRGLGWLLVFRKIQEKLGGRFIAGISGGGALPISVDRFFDALGVRILEGYGLTETAPVIAARPQGRPTLGTVGPVLEGTELRIVNDEGRELHYGRKGRILVRGPQVMSGYYRKPELTASVLTADGFLDTGDLGVLTRHGELRIAGRAKDTIVLRGGENVEPTPIEQRLGESDYIQQAMIVGQDQRYLAALVVPDEEAVTAWAKENNVPIVDYEQLLTQPEILELIGDEVGERISARNGFKSFERVFKFALLARPFEVGRELSAKQELKRHVINELYAHQIQALFRD
jgi:long-chain acyl-CoA synthetase